MIFGPKIGTLFNLDPTFPFCAEVESNYFGNYFSLLNLTKKTSWFLIQKIRLTVMFFITPPYLPWTMTYGKMFCVNNPIGV